MNTANTAHTPKIRVGHWLSHGVEITVQGDGLPHTLTPDDTDEAFAAAVRWADCRGDDRPGPLKLMVFIPYDAPYSVSDAVAAICARLPDAIAHTCIEEIFARRWTDRETEIYRKYAASEDEGLGD